MTAAALGGIASLAGEARAEFRGGIFAGEDEQIVERGHGAPQGHVRQALVEAVKQVGPARAERLRQQPPPGIGRQRSGPGAQVAVGPVAEIEAGFRMGGSQTAQDLARIQPHAGKLVSHAVGGIQGNSGRFAQEIGHRSFVSAMAV